MEISKLVRRLNDNEIAQYEDKGYIKGMPVFSQGGVKDLQKLCDEQGLCPEVSTVPFTEEGCRSAFKSLHPPKNEKRSTRGKIVVNVYNPDDGNDDDDDDDYSHDS